MRCGAELSGKDYTSQKAERPGPGSDCIPQGAKRGGPGACAPVGVVSPGPAATPTQANSAPTPVARSPPGRGCCTDGAEIWRPRAPASPCPCACACPRARRCRGQPPPGLLAPPPTSPWQPPGAHAAHARRRSPGGRGPARRRGHGDPARAHVGRATPPAAGARGRAHAHAHARRPTRAGSPGGRGTHARARPAPPRLARAPPASTGRAGGGGSAQRPRSRPGARSGPAHGRAALLGRAGAPGPGRAGVTPPAAPAEGPRRPGHGVHLRRLLLHADPRAVRLAHLLRHLAHHRLRRAPHRLQEPDRPGQPRTGPREVEKHRADLLSPEEAGGARVLDPRALLPHVPLRGGVGDAGPQHPPALLPPVAVLPPPGGRLGGDVRRRVHHERGHPELLPEGVVVQTGLLPGLLLLLPVQYGLHPGEFLRPDPPLPDAWLRPTPRRRHRPQGPPGAEAPPLLL